MKESLSSPRPSQYESQTDKSMNTAVRRRKLTTTSIHIMALDGIVNVNSLFTLAVFLGLAFNPTDPHFTLVDPSAATPACAAAIPALGEDLVSFHVYSFSSFLFSSLVATALKLAVRTAKDAGGNGGAELNQVPTALVNLKVLRVGILASAAGSAAGCGFLTAALVDLVQIKLGTLACWSWDSLAAITPLIILVPSALVIYIFVVLHAFTS